MSGLQLTRVAGAIGTEVRGVDLTKGLGNDELAAISEVLADRLVVFFPDQHLDRDQHVAFARHFGELEVFHPATNSEASHSEVLSLHSEEGRIADVWHTDVTWSQHPPKASILRMVTNPDVGGDTMWSNQYLAFESLTEPFRAFISGLTAVHTGRVFGNPGDRAVHPVVRLHPETGRKSLYVNRQFTSHIVELSPGESDALLGYLWTWSEQPRFTCRYGWTEGTVAMWDNRCTQHYVVNDFDQPRTIERVTVLGDDPQPAAPTAWPAYEGGPLSAAQADFIFR